MNTPEKWDALVLKERMKKYMEASRKAFDEAMSTKTEPLDERAERFADLAVLIGAALTEAERLSTHYAALHDSPPRRYVICPTCGRKVYDMDDDETYAHCEHCDKADWGNPEGPCEDGVFNVTEVFVEGARRPEDCP